MQKIVIFGFGPIFKGGIAHFTSSLALALGKLPDTQTHIVSWINPYPQFIPRDFLDRKSQPSHLGNVQVHYVTDYNNIRSWHHTYTLIRALNPDIVLFEWSTAVQFLPMIYIARKLRRQTGITLLFDLHNIRSNRQTALVQFLTRKTIQYAHHYIVHSVKAACELKELFPETTFTLTDNDIPAVPENTKIILQLFHPIYDLFQPSPSFDVEAFKQQHHLRKYVFLFFGFILRYKGLHHVIDAFAQLCKERSDVSLLIVGESSWQTQNTEENRQQLMTRAAGIVKADFLSEADDESNYHPIQKIDELGLRDYVTVINEFVPNEEVASYFLASDYVMLYYETANSSGIEAIADALGIPVLATRVGHFPETIQDGYNGYLAEVDQLDSMIATMRKAILSPIPKDHVRQAARGLTWENYAHSIVQLLHAH